MNPSETAQLSSLIDEGQAPRFQIVAEFIQLGFIAMLLRWFFFENSEIGPTWQVLVTGGLLVAIWRSMGWVVLMATQLNLFVGEPRRFDAHLTPEAVLTCFVLLVLLAYTCSFRTTRRTVQLWLAMLIGPALGSLRPAQTSTQTLTQAAGKVILPEVGSAAQSELTLGRRIMGLVVRLLTIFAIVLVSVVLFGLLPLSAHARERWWQLSLSHGQTLWPGPTALVFVLACVIVFAQSQWRRIRPAQARLYLRSMFVRYHYADLRMIVLRQFRAADAKPIAKELASPKRLTTAVPLENKPAS